MDIYALIDWHNATRLERMIEHLKPHEIDKKSAVEHIFGASNPTIEKRIQVSLQMGTYESLSYFIFIESSGFTSQVVGYCPTGQLNHLWSDFDFLCSQMNELDIFYKIKDVHIRLNGQKLYKKSLTQFFFKRNIIKDLIILPGGLTIVSTLLSQEGLRFDAITFIAGLILWAITFCIGYLTEEEYVLRK